MNLMKKELNKNNTITTNTNMIEIINLLKIINEMNFFKKKILIKIIKSDMILKKIRKKMNITITQTNITTKLNKIEEDLHHQIDVHQEEMLGPITVNSKQNMVLKTIIVRTITSIEIKIGMVAITDMMTVQEEMIIKNVSLIMKLRTEIKIIL